MKKPDAATLVETIARKLTMRKMQIASAESCTGGLLAKLMTDRAGSSAWFERGLITYTNQAKSELLGVPESVFEQHGAVSGECVAAMAAGLLQRAPVDWTLAVSGVAGPGGGSDDKPVGTVWLAWALRGAAPITQKCWFPGDREAVRMASALALLNGLNEQLGD